MRMTAKQLVIPVNPLVAVLESAHARLIRNPLCMPSYFSPLRSMLGMIDRETGPSRRFRSAVLEFSQNSNLPFARFEECTPVQREQLMLTVIRLFENWPDTFVDVVRSCRPHVPLRPMWSPPWFTGALELARGNKSYTSDRVRDAFWFSATLGGWYLAAEFLMHPYLKLEAA